MDELQLVRLHEDGDHLVVAGPDGAEHTLPITDALRAAVRGDRPRMEQVRAEAQLTIRPRDIQARLRAGATADELAAESGMPLDQIRRFEYPVDSERNHAVGRVRGKAVMSDDGGTATIGDLADKRLKERASRPASIDWTATREGVAPWVVTLRFTVEAGDREARWSFDPRGGAVIALDDEARWLSQPEDDGGPVSRTVTALPPTRGFGRTPPPDDETDLLLDGLSERRGQRPPRGPEPATFDVGELELDELSPRRRRPESVPVATVARPPDTDEDSDEPDRSATEGGSASVVDLGSRREKTGAPPGDQFEWDGPSQWDIPDRNATEAAADDERRPRTAALRTGGPLTGAIPKPSTGPVPRSRKPADPSADGGSSVGPAVAPDSGAPETGRTDGAPSGRSDPDGTVPDKAATDATNGKTNAKKARRSSRRGRAQVPSWDEIVFGSRPDA